MFKEFRALSLFKVCHVCWKVMWPHTLLWFNLWLILYLDGVLVKSCLVSNFVYITCTSLFLISDPLSVFASLLYNGWSSHLLYQRERVQNIVLCSTRFASCPQFPVMLRPDLSLCCCLCSINADTTIAGCFFYVFCFKCCVCGSECKVKAKTIVFYRKKGTWSFYLDM